MSKYMKKLAAVLLAFAFIVMLPAGFLVSFAATGKISFSDPTASVGNQVSVNMKITSDEALGSSDVMLEYDSSALEFVSGTNANGGAGSVRVKGSMESEGQKTFSFTLKFKALKAGTSSITVKSQEVYDAASQAVTISHVGNSAVKVNAADSSSKDATLSSLTIAPGTLTPAFSADVTEYTAVVSSDVTSVTVSAPANDSNATVSISGNDDLQDGENTITCKVTAEDGTTATYTILVTKSDNAETSAEEPVDETGTETDGNAGVVGEEGNWTVAETFDDADLPDGFTATETEYDGKTVKAATDDTGITLLYMTDDSGNGDFFVYDSEKGTLSPYVVVRMAEKNIVVLPPECIPEGTALPDGFAECTIDIGDHTVHGWIWKDSGDEAPEYCVVYGRNENGEEGFYRYDQKEMTLQRYFQDPDAADARSKYIKVAEDYNSLLKDYDIRGFVVIGLFALCIVLVIIIIILLLRKPKAPVPSGKGGYRDEDDYEYETPKRSKRTEKRNAPKKTERTDRKTSVRRQAREDDFLYEEEEMPRRRQAAPAARRPAAEERPVRSAAPAPVERPAARPVVTSARSVTAPARPAQRNVEEAERALSRSLAGEMKKTAPVQEKEADDDFEYIDLDL